MTASPRSWAWVLGVPLRGSVGARDTAAASFSTWAASAASLPASWSLVQGEDKSSFVFMERYVDDAALAAHRQTDHFKTLGRAMGAHMDGPPVVLRMTELG